MSSFVLFLRPEQHCSVVLVQDPHPEPGRLHQFPLMFQRKGGVHVEKYILWQTAFPPHLL